MRLEADSLWDSRGDRGCGRRLLVLIEFLAWLQAMCDHFRVRIANLIFPRPEDVKRMRELDGLLRIVAKCNVNELSGFELL